MSAKTARLLSVCAVLAAVLLHGSCRVAGPPQRPPNVLLISLDTFRADYFGRRSESGEPITPNLSRLAAEAVSFEHAFTPVPFTLSAHMSMLTGLYPDAHGVVDESTTLSSSIEVLPRILQRSGYSTLGCVTSDWLKGTFGFRVGFDRYAELATGDHLTYAERVNEQALSYLDAADPEKPWFLFLHYFDAHSDYRNQQNTLPYYSPPAFREDLEGGDLDQDFCDDKGRCATEFLQAVNRRQTPLSPETLRSSAELYGRGIHYLDHHLGRLFDQLEARGLYRDSLIVLTTDHGEEFLEHGKLLHKQVYDETVRVLLLIKFPGGEHGGTVVGELAATLDIMPTVLGYLELPIPATTQGKVLLPTIRDREPVREGVLMREKNKRWRYAYRTRERKLIHDFNKGRSRLYDLVEDPDELRDASQARKEEASALRQELERQVRLNRRLALELQGDEPEGEILSQREKERLRALGYLD